MENRRRLKTKRKYIPNLTRVVIKKLVFLFERCIFGPKSRQASDLVIAIDLSGVNNNGSNNCNNRFWCRFSNTKNFFWKYFLVSMRTLVWRKKEYVWRRRKGKKIWRRNNLVLCCFKKSKENRKIIIYDHGNCGLTKKLLRINNKTSKCMFLYFRMLYVTQINKFNAMQYSIDPIYCSVFMRPILLSIRYAFRLFSTSWTLFHQLNITLWAISWTDENVQLTVDKCDVRSRCHSFMMGSTARI